MHFLVSLLLSWVKVGQANGQLLQMFAFSSFCIIFRREKCFLSFP